jgi:alcohol dehydrogenase
MTIWNQPFSFTLPTKIVFGPGCIKDLGSLITGLGGAHPLFITDSGVIKAGILEKALEQLGKEFKPVIFDGVEANPRDVNVAVAAYRYRKAHADCIVAIGGGGPIDCAKAAGVLIANKGDNIKAFEGMAGASKPIPPLIAIPTTAGTGSELTFSAMITDTANHYKMTIKNACAAAKIAVCDPELTLTSPPALTASAGMDALTHAIEAYTASCAEPLADAAALYAVELIAQNLPVVFKNGSDLTARGKMLMGSMLGGIAFSHSDAASVHCITAALGGMYDLPPGVCNSIILPFIMEYNLNYSVDGYARIARAMGLKPDQGREGALAAVEAVRKLAREVKLPPFSSLNVDEKDFPLIARTARENISNQSNPRPMTEEDYLKVLQTMASA